MIYRKQYDVVIQVNLRLQIAKFEEWLMAEKEIWMKVERDHARSRKGYITL